MKVGVRFKPMRKFLIGITILVVSLILFFKEDDPAPVPSADLTPIDEQSEPSSLADALPTPVGVTLKPALTPTPNSDRAGLSMNVQGKRVSVPASTPRSGAKEEAPTVRQFIVEDGVAVIDGDIVLGVPVSGAQSGNALLPTLNLWPSRVIPYHIQPSLPEPGRVLEALQMFSGTYITFVPYTDQEDVLVFQSGTGTCKSYVGMSGGKQPLWLSPGCGPHEVAHEIMHALGFTHEQNRYDRDAYIRLNRENIEQSKMTNFEKMPETFMQISGQSEFSFNSIMIYPPDMFSINNRPTMTSLRPSEQISPSQSLSPRDIDRLNRVYGSR